MPKATMLASYPHHHHQLPMQSSFVEPHSPSVDWSLPSAADDHCGRNAYPPAVASHPSGTAAGLAARRQRQQRHRLNRLHSDGGLAASPPPQLERLDGRPSATRSASARPSTHLRIHPPSPLSPATEPSGPVRPDEMDARSGSLPTPTHTPHSFLAPEFANYDPDTHDAETNREARRAMLRALEEQCGSGESSGPASTADPSAPLTPSTPYDDALGDGPRTGRTDVRGVVPTIVPKLDRTISDIYQDELYHPAMCAPTPTTPAPAHSPQAHRRTSSNPSLLSPFRNVFSERIQAAHQGHLQAQAQTQAHSPASSIARERSPFRHGSPYAPSPSSFEALSPQPRLGSAAHMREPSRALRRPSSAAAEEEDPMTPQTISPQEALLEYHETPEDATMPLFPPATPAGTTVPDADDRRHSSSHYPATSGPTPTSSEFTFASSALPGGGRLQVPQQYPFIPRPAHDEASPARAELTPDFPAHLTSMESSVSDDVAEPPFTGEILRPARTAADTGTYTCTYHGCTLRFETPAKLQRHKRDGHRHAVPAHHLAGLDRGAGSSELLLRDTQAGPHKCERVNPSTGKPCNTIFSRPYDLTRHEDTIHNARKQKVRCQYCTEDKTFSRHDALTRHMRVVHPEIEFGARSRRKNHSV